MSDIKNIVFDFGGILFDIDVPNAIQNMSELVNVNYSIESKSIPEGFIPILQAYEVGSINTETFVWKLQHISTKKHHAIAYIKAWNSMLIGMKKEKFSQLLKLRENYNVYLLSNINDSHLNWIYRYFEQNYQITDWENKYFDKTYYSHLIGMRKPNLDIFEYVWKDADIRPEESLFIDDTIENVEMAQSMGIKTIHHNPSNNIFEILKEYNI